MLGQKKVMYVLLDTYKSLYYIMKECLYVTELDTCCIAISFNPFTDDSQNLLVVKIKLCTLVNIQLINSNSHSMKNFIIE